MTEILVSLQSLIPQHGLSRLVGWLADLERPVWLKRLLIVAFARSYDIDFGYTESRRSAEWRSFNEFFTRPLRDGARPVAETRYVQPAEGLISQYGVVDEGWLVQAKNRWYSAQDLLAGSADEAQAFDGACFMTTYLSPRDYHRVHMPISGRLTRTRYVPGDLFAVNQHTAHGVDRLYARNERLVCFFDTADGEMALVLVGAVIVAGIETVWGGREQPDPSGIVEKDWQGADIQLAAGAEMGRFYLGSTVVALFPRGDLTWQCEQGALVQVNGPLAEPTPAE
jgi:phosphatidylserine decarboxylase